jgi:hypothetical protein
VTTLRVGSVSAATGYKYADLAEKGNPFAEYYAGLSANETGADDDYATDLQYEWRGCIMRSFTPCSYRTS